MGDRHLNFYEPRDNLELRLVDPQSALNLHRDKRSA